MLRLLCACVAALLSCAGFGLSAHAGKKVALVVGNSEYRFTPPLANPRNDAVDVANALKSFGFQVLEGFDLEKPAMDALVRAYAEALVGAETGIFFYAGHGVQVSGQNYLVPVDAQLITASSLDFEMVRLDLIQRTMEREASTNIIFLDACRNNPLTRNLSRSLGTRSAEIGSGLASVEAGQGTLISFSTQPGAVALDGAGRNSPYTEALLKHISKPGDDLSSTLIKVRTDVIEATSRSQVPWEHSSLTSRFYFTDRPPNESEAAELALWEKVKDSLDPEAIAEYTREYPQGTFAVLARSLIEALRKQKETAASAAAITEKQQRELEAARGEVKRAQAALKAAEDAKRRGVNIAALTPPTGPAARFDGVWRVVRISETCGRRIVEFNVTIKDGVATTRRGSGSVSATGDFSFTGNPADGGISTFNGKLTGTTGAGKAGFRRPERNFSCGGTFTMSKVN